VLIQAHQNVIATLSTPPSYLVFFTFMFLNELFVKVLDSFAFIACWWCETVWFGQFMLLQLDYDVIKHQENRLRRYYQTW